MEDEPLLAMLEEDLLTEAGAVVVGPAPNVATALALIDSDGPDGAVLDVNLGAEFVHPVADRLATLEVPFVFVTGYGRSDLLERFGARPIIAKPFSPTDFAKRVSDAIAAGADDL